MLRGRIPQHGDFDGLVAALTAAYASGDTATISLICRHRELHWRLAEALAPLAQDHDLGPALDLVSDHTLEHVFKGVAHTAAFPALFDRAMRAGRLSPALRGAPCPTDTPRVRAVFDHASDLLRFRAGTLAPEAALQDENIEVRRGGVRGSTAVGDHDAVARALSDTAWQVRREARAALPDGWSSPAAVLHAAGCQTDEALAWLGALPSTLLLPALHGFRAIDTPVAQAFQRHLEAGAPETCLVCTGVTVRGDGPANPYAAMRSLDRRVSLRKAQSRTLTCRCGAALHLEVQHDPHSRQRSTVVILHRQEPAGGLAHHDPWTRRDAARKRADPTLLTHRCAFVRSGTLEGLDAADPVGLFLQAVEDLELPRITRQHAARLLVEALDPAQVLSRGPAAVVEALLQHPDLWRDRLQAFIPWAATCGRTIATAIWTLRPKPPREALESFLCLALEEPEAVPMACEVIRGLHTTTLSEAVVPGLLRALGTHEDAASALFRVVEHVPLDQVPELAEPWLDSREGPNALIGLLLHAAQAGVAGAEEALARWASSGNHDVAQSAALLARTHGVPYLAPALLGILETATTRDLDYAIETLVRHGARSGDQALIEGLLEDPRHRDSAQAALDGLA